VKRTLVDLFKLIIPVSRYKNKYLNDLKEYLDNDELKKTKYLAKLGKIGFSTSNLGLSKKLMLDIDYPQINLACTDKDVKKFVENINSTISYKVMKVAFRKFSENADEKIKEFVAPNIIGLENVKEACILQLFASDRAHILLLGDPQTGKTDIIRSISNLHPITTFGLGSGTSGVGLAATVKGNEVIKGLLPKADQGICCIDELNLMKNTDRASLYSAMEKGFISYDKGSKHMRMDANIRILATANPKLDRFVGRTIDVLKDQIPFDEALLSRFNLVFLIREPSQKEFLDITKNIVSKDPTVLVNEDINFIKEYVNFAEDIKVDFPKMFEKDVVNFIEYLKKNEDNFLVRIGPRTVIGFIRLCKANARLNLRNDVRKSDIDKVKNIFEEALFVRKNTKDNN
jgi:DNA replicative helicase MCM subunit Mcm2 (Cdc46/Mcm family)